MLLTISFLLLLIIGVPIGITTGMATILCILEGGVKIEIIAQRMYSGVDSFSLMAIPFFIFAGDLMLQGGTSKRLVAFANKLFGWISGGIPITAVVSCMIFAALSGSSPATVAGIGGVMIPNMVEKKYPKKFAVGLMCAAGSLGIIIPPSITMLTYGVVSEQSISSLFLAGLLPGIFIGLVLIIICYVYSKINKFPLEKRPTLIEVFQSFKEAILSLLMPVIILGGIYSGIATPTESAAVAIVYSMVVGIFIYKEIQIKDLFKISKKSVTVSAMIMFVIATSKVFSWYLTFAKVPTTVAEYVLQFAHSPIMILFLINILFLFVGMIMDSSAAVLILTPLLLPIVTEVGVNPIHFGVIMIVNLAIGMLTPPFGLNLFVATGLTKMSLVEVVQGTIPFIFALIALLMVITYVPALSLVLLGL